MGLPTVGRQSSCSGTSEKSRTYKTWCHRASPARARVGATGLLCCQSSCDCTSGGKLVPLPSKTPSERFAWQVAARKTGPSPAFCGSLCHAVERPSALAVEDVAVDFDANLTHWVTSGWKSTASGFGDHLDSYRPLPGVVDARCREQDPQVGQRKPAGTDSRRSEVEEQRLTMNENSCCPSPSRKRKSRMAPLSSP